MSPPPVPSNTEEFTHTRPTARDPALLTGKGGYDKDDSLCGGTLSAAATRNLFRKKQDFIHNGRGCEERGHILKEAPLCVRSYWF